MHAITRTAVALRPLVVVAASFVILTWTAIAALAAPPANDDFDAATVITSLPFVETIDATEATSADDDPPFGFSSIWYRFTAPSDMGIEYATDSPGNPSLFYGAFVGSRGALELVDGAGSADGELGRFNATAGETYFFGIFDAEGEISFSVEEIPLLPPRLELSISVDPTGTISPRFGTATITGEVSCSVDPFDTFGMLGGFVEQTRRSRLIAHGLIDLGNQADDLCLGDGSWSATTVSQTGRFRAGVAVVTGFFRVFDTTYGDWAVAQTEESISLERVRR